MNMTNKQFILALVILAIIYILVTKKKDENIYPVPYSNSEIQVMPYAGDVPTPPMIEESGENTFIVQ